MQHGSHIRTVCPDCGSALQRLNFTDPKTLRPKTELKCPTGDCCYEEVFDVTLASGKVSSGD
jgi:hypothetical protein